MFTVKKANEFIKENKDSVKQDYRHHYHFMAPIGWINDPNGFIYYKGEYHLFYQYYPYDSVWGPMHWGHAKSKDLITWEHLPVALAPDQPYDKDGCFSGSAIEKDGKLYLNYTGFIKGETEEDHRQVQCVAVSSDGIHFEKVEQNPVLTEKDLPENILPQDFRDPKVIYRNGVYYSFIVAKSNNNTGNVLLYESKDLINWEFKSVFLEGTVDEGEMWECPDIFELDGKDVLIISPINFPKHENHFHNSHTSLVYIGKADWEKGTFQKEAFQEIDHSLDFYAPQTIVDEDGRRILIAWMQMWGRNIPTDTDKHGWAGAMSLPRELSIQNNQLIQKPISFIQDYYQNEQLVEKEEIVDSEMSYPGIEGNICALEIDVNVEDATTFEVFVHANDEERTVISYHKESGKLELNRELSGHFISGNEEIPLNKRAVFVDPTNKELKLQVYLDRSSVELFVNDGIHTLTSTVYPTKEAKDIRFRSEGKTFINYIKKWNIEV